MDLKCLRGQNNDYKLKGKEILAWHHNATRKCNVKYNGQFSYFKNIDDLMQCSDEILYFTAHTYLYRPFINDPLKDAYPFGDHITYPNFQNLEAKRYYMFCDIVIEKLYNYWDRIGDLIGSFFPESIKHKDVYFARAIDIVPKEFQDNDPFKWLYKFKDTDYKEINDKRRDVVHYSSSDTELRHKHIFNSSDRHEIEKWIKERNAMPDFSKRQIELTIEGFYQTICLLEIISVEKFKDIE